MMGRRYYYREESIQKSCVEFFKWRYTKYFWLLFHPANEGIDDPRRGGRLKAEGVKAGVPDLMLPVSRHGYHCLGIEMKTEKGRQSDSQKRYQKWFERAGNLYAVCRSRQEFVDLCHDYLGEEHDPDAEDLRMIQEYDRPKPKRVSPKKAAETDVENLERLREIVDE